MDNMNHFHLTKIERSTMTLASFIFITAEFLGYVFKLHSTSLHRAWVQIRNYGLCIEKETKLAGSDISVSFGYGYRTSRSRVKH